MPAADSPPDQLRSSTIGVSLSVVGVAAVAIFGDRATRIWTLLTLFTFWVSAAMFVPVVRALVRQWFSQKAWWGHPVVVLGAARTGRLIVRTLQSQRERGLRPVFMLDDDPAKQGTLRASLTNERQSVEVRSMTGSALDFISPQLLASAAAELAEGLNVAAASLRPSDPPLVSGTVPTHDSSRCPRPPSSRPSRSQRPASPRSSQTPARAACSPRSKGCPSSAISRWRRSSRSASRFATPSWRCRALESQKLLRISERVGGSFTHMLIIPDLLGFGSLGVPARDIGGMLGLEVEQRLLLPWSRLAKRITRRDPHASSAASSSLPVILAPLPSSSSSTRAAPVLYRQMRLGRDGRQFAAAKFRTMYGDGEARLKAILEANPKLAREYEEFHKLARDPRVTRIGRILRKYSLDELPQLLNVIAGEMSLVGPRPYLEREVKDMDGQEVVILRAVPGMTGMWQVSDRNSTGFAERLKMDVHYVRNWSPWLDIYLLARTFEVVIKRDGRLARRGQ